MLRYTCRVEGIARRRAILCRFVSPLTWTTHSHSTLSTASAAPKMSSPQPGQQQQRQHSHSISSTSKRKSTIHTVSTNTTDAAAYVGGAGDDEVPDYSVLRHNGYLSLHSRRLWLPALMAAAFYAAAPLYITTPFAQGAICTLGVVLQRLSVRGRMNTVRRDLAGHTCVVTGGTSGIGLYTALQLLDMGAHVVLCVRAGREEATREFLLQNGCANVKGAAPINERLTFVQLDLADQLDVMACAARIKGLFKDRIDLLVNCAGLWREEPGLTRQGFEEHIGVNFLGPFHLTEALLPSLRRSQKGGRIVYVTCATHNGVHRGNVVRERMLLKPSPDESQITARCYSASKLGNIYHAQSLAARRYEGIPLNQRSDLRPVDVCVADPGFCATELTSCEAPPLLGRGILARTLRSLWIKDGYEGSQTVVNCCVRGEVENGGYYAECALMPSGLSRRAHDTRSRDEVVQWAMAKTIAKYYTVRPQSQNSHTSSSHSNASHSSGATRTSSSASSGTGSTNATAPAATVADDASARGAASS